MLVVVVVLVLGALGFRDRKETDVLQLICSVSLIAKRSGFSRTRTTTSTRTTPQIRFSGLIACPEDEGPRALSPARQRWAEFIFEDMDLQRDRKRGMLDFHSGQSVRLDNRRTANCSNQTQERHEAKRH